ncbi:unnamed protein product [Polarella glacialis]|uniref:Uncharacterized protein n=1 Tax=Polarella glacialis TaxID=89957 RepID=A0A813K8C7_POLGL|nr:unnamed protein product [Polarella glacialis]
MRPPLDQMPSFCMVSENYYRKAERLKADRRLRNVVCFIEWRPGLCRRYLHARLLACRCLAFRRTRDLRGHAV